MKKRIKKRINKNIEFEFNKNIIICLLVLFFFLYKGFNFFYYDVNNILFGKVNEYEKVFKGLYFKKSIEINEQEVSNNDYIEFKDVKIRNDFKNFVVYSEDDNSITYQLINEFNKVQASLQIISYKTYLDRFIEEEFEDFRYNSIDRKKIIKENHITNDIEFIEFLRSKKNKSNNIFTRVKNMKEDFAVKYFVSIAIPRFDYLTLIEGDYEGYLFDNFNYSNSQLRQAVILKNNKSYAFTFYGCCYFSDSDIKELLSTVVIE